MELPENPVIEIGRLEKLVYKLPYEYTYEKIIAEHEYIAFDGNVFKSEDEANKHVEKCLKDRNRVLKLIKEDVLTTQELEKLFLKWKLLTSKTPKEIKVIKCNAVIRYHLYKENDYTCFTDDLGLFRSEEEMKEAIIDDLNINIWHTYFEKNKGDWYD